MAAPNSLRRRRWALEIAALVPLGARNRRAGAAGRSKLAAPLVPWFGPAWRLESKTPQPLQPLRPGASKAPQPLQPGASKTLQAAAAAAGRRLENAAAAAAAAACAYELAVSNHCSKSQFEVTGLGFTSLGFSALCFT